VTGVHPSESHHALDDVKSTSTILQFEHFWEAHKEHVFQFLAHDDANVQAVVACILDQQPPIQDQVDDSSGSSIGSSSSSSSS
jgi:hypothetical protein